MPFLFKFSNNLPYKNICGELKKNHTRKTQIYNKNQILLLFGQVGSDLVFSVNGS